VDAVTVPPDILSEIPVDKRSATPAPTVEEQPPPSAEPAPRAEPASAEPKTRGWVVAAGGAVAAAALASWALWRRQRSRAGR
jgi:hypothetical protein